MSKTQPAHYRPACWACGTPPLHWEYDGPLTGTGTGGNLNIHPTGRPARRRQVSDWEPVPPKEEAMSEQLRTPETELQYWIKVAERYSHVVIPKWQARAEAAEAELADARQRLAAVEALHTPYADADGSRCGFDDFLWPCETATAVSPDV